ncbi:MAG: sigma-54 dependent transcriptional regulator [Verrucomicrobiota bacterium]
MVKLRRILVLDDESAVRSVTADILRELDYSALAVSSTRQAEELLEKEEFDLVLSDIRLDGESGMDFLKGVRQMHPDLPLMIMTGFGTLDSAVEAIRLGVFEYLIKPIEPDFLQLTLQRLEQSLTLKEENTYLREGADKPESSEGFYWGESAAMQAVLKTVKKIGNTDTTVLIRGESGTGKEVVARTLYQQGLRSSMPFIRVNCAAIPETLLESEFFGHEKGAFTGANKRRKGRFELADEGTLMLDEISEIPPDLQVKLLRVLQEREFERVGGNQTIQVDVNIIATTNRKLADEVKAGHFREDLYYRLNVVPIDLPPLRERGNDVVKLAHFFAQQFARKHGKSPAPFSADGKLALKAYAWPGNVRELQNAIERAVILSDDGAELRPVESAPLAEESKPDDASGHEIKTIAELEREAIIQALKRNDGNRTHAAKMLGISLRTMRNKLARYRQDGVKL